MEKRMGIWGVAGVTFLLFGVVLAATIHAEDLRVLNITGEGTKACVVIDAGHGGFDPGKVGVAGTLEKDINLSIALKLKKVLADSGYQVVMTRETDCALSEENASKKKMTDLKNRVEKINQQKPAVAVSIHQNSYSAQTKGAQVFYYQHSEDSHQFAKVLQDTMREELADGNQRVEKENNDYYMLKKTEGILAIIECGFLSNPEEEALLKTDEYQQRMAEVIAEGIENFLYTQ